VNDIWVGLTDVSKNDDCELNLDGAGAFVWWATQASSEEEFLRKLTKGLEHYKLALIEVERIRSFDESDEVSEDFYEMVERARQNPEWVCFGTFNTYPHHTA